MIEAEIPANEDDRLHELRALCILDTDPELRFDRITLLAQRLFRTDIALVSFVDANRQWFKSRQGLDAQETDRSISFCGHAIHSDQPFIVEDTKTDPRFFDNPLVTAAPDIRFYAGQPLHGPHGFRVGTLCVIHSQPRHFSVEDQESLLVLAQQVETELLTKHRDNMLTVSLEQVDSLTDRSLHYERLSLVAKHTDNTVIITNAMGEIEWVNPAFCRLTGYTFDEVNGKKPGAFLQGPATDQTIVAQIRADLLLQRVCKVELLNYHKNGDAYWVQLNIQPIFDQNQQLSRFIAIETDISAQKLVESQARNNAKLLKSAARIAGVGAWSVDLVKNEITWSDQTCLIHEVAFGHQPSLEEAIAYYVPESRSMIQGLVQAAIENGQGFEAELQMMTAKQKLIWVRSIGEVEFEHGQAVRIIGTFQDITERYMLDRMKTEFISMVNHELRTPLTSIRGALGLLDSGSWEICRRKQSISLKSRTAIVCV